MAFTCINSTKLSVPKSVPEPIHRDNFDFAQALGAFYPILSLIFDYLPYSDLKNCLSVCESWRNQAQQTLMKRKNVDWFTCYSVKKIKRCVHSCNMMAHSKNMHYNNAEVAIIFYNSLKLNLNETVCVHSDNSEQTRLTAPEYFETHLIPPKIDYCLLSVQKAASNFDSNRSVEETEFYGSIFDGVIIPKIPSIRTAMFVCNASKRQELEECVKLHLQPNETPKCLLLFCKSQLHESLYNILEFILPNESPNSVALGGGIIKGTKTFQKVSHAKQISTAKTVLCIVFLKDTKVQEDNFCAYSIVIKGSGLSKEEFDSHLYQLKDSTSLKRHSVGFRFCCSSKYQTSELQSFADIFPTVPIIGLEAYGEIGWNCYPTQPMENLSVPKTMALDSNT